MAGLEQPSAPCAGLHGIGPAMTRRSHTWSALSSQASRLGFGRSPGWRIAAEWTSHPYHQDASPALQRYVALLRRWNRSINLVSARDIPVLWTRHIADSLQLGTLWSKPPERAIDLGSGGGFPGLVLAIQYGVPFDLIEQDQGKATFLREAARVTGAPVTVVATKIEAAAVPRAPLMTARGLAPLSGLLGYAEHLLTAGRRMSVLERPRCGDGNCRGRNARLDHGTVEQFPCQDGQHGVILRSVPRNCTDLRIARYRGPTQGRDEAFDQFDSRQPDTSIHERHGAEVDATAMDDQVTEDPQTILDRMEQQSVRHETPCGDGSMVWHIWDTSGGTAPVVVLFHGGAGSWRHWAHNIPVLSQHYRVLVPDLPGLGEFAIPAEERRRRAIARSRRRRYRCDCWAPRRPTTSLGFSFGGTMASCVGALHGKRVRSVTIIGSCRRRRPRGHAVELLKVRHLQGQERVDDASHQPQSPDDCRSGEDRCAGADHPGLEHRALAAEDAGFVAQWRAVAALDKLHVAAQRYLGREWTRRPTRGRRNASPRCVRGGLMPTCG